MSKKTRTPLAPRWIICTRWESQEQPERPVAPAKKDTVEEGKAEPTPAIIDKAETTPVVEKAYTPIGTNGKIPFSYATLKEAEDAVYEIMDCKPGIKRAKVSALKVKYVPNKIKLYRQNWFEKYVLEEVTMTFETEKKVAVL